VNAIAAVGGPTYQWRQINPVDGQDGGEPGGNIRVAFLYNPARVSFVDRPGGTPTAAVGVVNASGVPQLTFSPGRIDPLNVAFNSSRKPLAGEFLFKGNRLFVIANHFNSKGGDQPLFGPTQPPVLSSEGPRNQQATIVRNFVQQILAIDAGANVVVLGDLNDFEFSSPLTILKSASLTPLVETLPPEERYSYVFEGNSQALDHIMVSSALLNASAEYDVVHVNAEYVNQTSDHDPGVARFFLPRTDLEDSVDLNGDGKIDCADLAIIKSPSFLKRNGQPGFDPRADVNKDGIVDIKDWALVFQRVPAATWTQCR
jgi:predicted extracellular nuclease